VEVGGDALPAYRGLPDEVKGTSKNRFVSDALAIDAGVSWLGRGVIGAVSGMFAF